MNALKAFVFGVALWPCSSRLAAQQATDSVTTLGEVVVRESRLDDYAAGHYTLQLDSANLQLASFGSALADIMRRCGYGHVRSYGPGGLSTPSFRGSGASHTAVMWNGINLQGALNGQADLSHMPAYFLDDVHIQTGGSASLYGSGAIGGTIHLNNKATFSQGLALRATGSLGSFGNWLGGTTIGWSGKKFSTSTRMVYATAENDFPYVNTYTNPRREEQRAHSGLEQYGILHEDYWQVAKRHLVNARLWYQDNRVEVPYPTSVPRSSEASQRDEFFRSMVNWSFDQGQTHLSYQSSHVHHFLTYDDPQASIASNSTFNSFVNSLEVSRALLQTLEGTVALSHIFENGMADEFTPRQPERSRTALIAALKYSRLPKWKALLSARQEMVGRLRAPLAPAVTLEILPVPKVRTFANVSRNYRIPTFNDLYWSGAGAAGNPDLQPELSWSEEAGVEAAIVDDARSKVRLKAAAFSNQADDWILWAPVGLIWSPGNIKRVWARGLESNLAISSRLGPISATATLIYTFTKSTATQIYADDLTSELNKQLIYTPVHEGSASLRAETASTAVTVIYSYTGEQFTDGSNTQSQAMRAYHTLNAWISHEVRLGGLQANAMLEGNNLLDAPYESRPGYPMPGRNYRVGLSLRLNKKSTK